MKRWFLVLTILLSLVAAACGQEESAPEGEPAAEDDPADEDDAAAEDEPADNVEAADDDGGDDLLALIQERGELRVATDPAYPPQSSIGDDGELEGFDIDVATEIAERLGVEVAFETPAWDLIIAGSWQDRWDLSVGSMTVTPDRAEVLHFTEPYYFAAAAVAVHEDNTEAQDPADDLDGARIGVCGGCTYEFYLDQSLDIPGEELEFVIDDPDVTTYDTDASAISDLSLGDGTRLDAVMSARPTLEEAIAEGRPIRLVGDPVFFEPLAAAVDQEAPADPEPFVEEVSRVITEMHDDGTLSEFSEQWYGTDLTKRE